jgi:hypothetical protein
MRPSPRALTVTVAWAALEELIPCWGDTARSLVQVRASS